MMFSYDTDLETASEEAMLAEADTRAGAAVGGAIGAVIGAEDVERRKQILRLIIQLMRMVGG